MDFLTPQEVSLLQDWDDAELSKAVKTQEREHSRASRLMDRNMVYEFEAENFLSSHRKPIKFMAGGLTQQQIEIAKSYPFSELVGAKVGGKILCPGHEDRRPSMAVYPNGAHCFVCGEHHDSISWLRKTRGMSFYEAVKELNGNPVA
jgi:hypothetical protein